MCPRTVYLAIIMANAEDIEYVVSPGLLLTHLLGDVHDNLSVIHRSSATCMIT